jgi:hypothetical protein
MSKFPVAYKFFFEGRSQTTGFFVLKSHLPAGFGLLDGSNGLNQCLTLLKFYDSMVICVGN